MAIEYSEAIPSASDYKRLFESTGWNKEFKASSDELMQALGKSWYVVCAYETSRLVGLGRLVSDGVLYAMIYDLIVMPSHQQRGIGSEILKRLIGRCREGGVRQVQLFTAAGKSDFYQKRGFEERPANAPGMQMRIQ
jgi:ribosomal protein S18 acetylase RimI-like enzyme